MSIYMRKAFPKMNSSFMLCSGTAIKSQITRLRGDKTFLVDTGVTAPRTCMEDELTGVHKQRNKTSFESDVGFMSLVAGETLMREKLLERFFIDLIAGEPEAKERAASRFKDMLGSTDGVPGEPHLLLPRRFRQKQAWMELNKLWRSNSKVKGFIIEKVRGGYSVAIAGYLAFLPHRPARSQRIANDRFTIERINEKPMNIVVF